VAAVINARRHQTYAGVYEAEYTSDYEQSAASAVMEEKQYMIEELLAELVKKTEENNASVLFTGDGIDAYRDIIENTMKAGTYLLAGEDIRYQHAESVARIALRRAKAGKTLSYNELMPEYMRLAEAEQRLRAGTLSDRIRKPVQ
jgi:tRNA threonylcarbamoyladenosine biosynthesis protein TsaB